MAWSSGAAIAALLAWIAPSFRTVLLPLSAVEAVATIVILLAWRSSTRRCAGDHEAAARVELTLPETGVRSGAGLFDEPTAAQSNGGDCCSVPADP